MDFAYGVFKCACLSPISSVCGRGIVPREIRDVVLSAVKIMCYKHGVLEIRVARVRGAFWHCSRGDGS